MRTGTDCFSETDMPGEEFVRDPVIQCQVCIVSEADHAVMAMKNFDLRQLEMLASGLSRIRGIHILALFQVRVWRHHLLR